MGDCHHRPPWRRPNSSRRTVVLGRPGFRYPRARPLSTATSNETSDAHLHRNDDAQLHVDGVLHLNTINRVGSMGRGLTRSSTKWQYCHCDIDCAFLGSVFVNFVRSDRVTRCWPVQLFLVVHSAARKSSDPWKTVPHKHPARPLSLHPMQEPVLVLASACCFSTST